MAKPYPENVDGDFYVELDCCTLCGVPKTEAPDLFDYASGKDGELDHCYVSKQPTTESEVAAMINANSVAELRCIRYRGCDPKLLLQLAKLGNADICDQSLSADRYQLRTKRPATIASEKSDESKQRFARTFWQVLLFTSWVYPLIAVTIGMLLGLANTRDAALGRMGMAALIAVPPLIIPLTMSLIAIPFLTNAQQRYIGVALIVMSCLFGLFLGILTVQMTDF